MWLYGTATEADRAGRVRVEVANKQRGPLKSRWCLRDGRKGQTRGVVDVRRDQPMMVLEVVEGAGAQALRSKGKQAVGEGLKGPLGPESIRAQCPHARDGPQETRTGANKTARAHFTHLTGPQRPNVM